MAAEQVDGPMRAPRHISASQERPPRQQSIPSQLSTLARRHVRVIAADRGYSAFMLLLPVVLAVITMVVPGHLGLKLVSPRRAGSEALQILIILTIGSVFMGTAVSVRELVGERAIYKREKAVGLSSTAYLGGKIAIFGLITLLQSVVLVLLVQLRKPPPTGSVLLGSPRVEIIAACWFTALCAMTLGLLMSSIVRTSEQVMPLLVVSIMAQLVLCGGLFPVTGRPVLEQLSWIAPARWGYAAGASTTDMNAMFLDLANRDPLWGHTPGHWLLAMLLLLLLSGVFSSFALFRITRKLAD